MSEYDGVIDPGEAEWADIPSFGTETVLLGGPDGSGPINGQAQAIAKRLNLLRDGLSNCVTKDGQTVITDTFNFSGQDVVGVEDFVAEGDATVGGNLLFTGTGNLIKGVMSGTPRANRLGFQNSITDAVSYLDVLPNGTGTQSAFNSFNASDRDNANVAALFCASSHAGINLATAGTATPVPFRINLYGTDRLTFGTDGSITFNGNVNLPSTTTIGSWQSYTPTLQGGGGSVAYSFRQGSYWTLNGMTFFWVRVNFSGYSVGSGMRLTLPNTSSQALPLQLQTTNFAVPSGKLLIARTSGSSIVFMLIDQVSGAQTDYTGDSSGQIYISGFYPN